MVYYTYNYENCKLKFKICDKKWNESEKNKITSNKNSE